MTHCAVTSDLNNWLNKQAEDEAKDEAIAEEADRLTDPGQEYEPFSAKNFAEALSEIAAGDCGPIADHFRAKAPCLGGALLMQLVTEYWHEQAIKKAEETVLASWHERKQRDPDER